MHTSIFIATSLDGFIARSDGTIDWLTAFQETLPEGEDAGYGAFMQDIDVIVMGRNTFETVLGFDYWPYEEIPVYVMTRGNHTMPEHLEGKAFFTSASPVDLYLELAEKYTHAYIDGGLTIQSFLRAGLIDDMTITTIPILLGVGKPLFGEVPTDIKLQLMDVKQYDGVGFVQVKYQVV